MSEQITMRIAMLVVSDRKGSYHGFYPVDLTYDPADPHCVRMVPVHQRVPWQFDRSLLEGIDEPRGIGDVQVYPVDSEWVAIELTTPDGHAVLHAPRADLVEFADATYQAVPRGREAMDLDAAVLKLLGSRS